eukprot:Anaeramoba_ignava/c19193_g1_i2.p1 GENE.c19193_g1_i2~~c19193_g1_i2.p1  ORF type:complete len:535 (-),score=203.66 c19193_g1_i2:48-1652(-)
MADSEINTSKTIKKNVNDSHEENELNSKSKEKKETDLQSTETKTETEKSEKRFSFNENSQSETPSISTDLIDENELKSSEWFGYAMREHPDILELRERTRPLSSIESFGRLLSSSKTESKDPLSRNNILKLVEHYLFNLGFKKTLHSLEEESECKFEKPILKDSQLHSLISVALSNIDTLWDLSLAEIHEEVDDPEVPFREQYIGLGVDDDDDDEFTYEDVSIWEEPPNSENNTLFIKDETKHIPIIRAGTLNKLVEELTTESTPNTPFINSFLFTYSSFISPYKLFLKLIQRFHVPKTPDLLLEDYGKKKQKIQLQTINIIKTWLELKFEDFNELMIYELTQFIDNVLANLGYKTQEKELRNLISKKQNQKEESKIEHFNENPPEPKVPKTIFSPKLSIFDIDEEEIARQLTIIDFEIFQKIQSSELLNKAWTNPKLKHRTPNVIQLIYRYNDLSKWVPNSILQSKKLKGRTKILGKFIKIAENLKSLNNYHSFMAIMAGIQHPKITNTKALWEDLPKKINRIISRIIKDNFK